MARKTRVHELNPKESNYNVTNRAALDALLRHFNNNKAQTAYAIGVHVNTVYKWVRKGQVGWHSAILIDENKNVPFTKEFLRNDVKVW